MKRLVFSAVMLKPAAGLLAAVLVGGKILEANSAGVVHLWPTIATAAFAVVALLSYDEAGIRYTFAWTAALAACAFARVPLELQGWMLPPVELALLIAVPALAVLSWRVARLTRRPVLRAFAVALMALLAVPVAGFTPPASGIYVAVVSGLVYVGLPGLFGMATIYLRRGPV